MSYYYDEKDDQGLFVYKVERYPEHREDEDTFLGLTLTYDLALTLGKTQGYNEDDLDIERLKVYADSAALE